MQSFALLFFLSSGLFLGWSLGANDAANVFGTAVGSQMLRFSTAAFICSVFVIIGAVVGGAGAADGLGELGAVNRLAGAFTVALAAALTVYWMTNLGLPISTSQAVVGAIIAWNLFSQSLTDVVVFGKIFATWIACPVLGALFAGGLYQGLVLLLNRLHIHLLTLDSCNRWGLILAGAFGSYALGANNIGNVMGVFVQASPFTDFSVAGLTFSSVHQLFFLGAIAIAVGVYTDSRRVMLTVGSSLMHLNPVAAFVVVVSHSLVLYIFSSQDLQYFLISHNLPAIPLIPVSSSQAVIGAVIGIGLLKGWKGVRQIRWRVLFDIACGWVTTPIIAALVGFVLLFVVQNVFNQQVFRPVSYIISQPVLEHLEKTGVSSEALQPLKGKRITSAIPFRQALREKVKLSYQQEKQVINSAEMYPMRIDANRFNELNKNHLNSEQIKAIKQLSGAYFLHKWQLASALAKITPAWQQKSAIKLNEINNKKLQQQLEQVYRIFFVDREVIGLDNSQEGRIEVFELLILP